MFLSLKEESLALANYSPNWHHRSPSILVKTTKKQRVWISVPQFGVSDKGKIHPTNRPWRNRGCMGTVPCFLKSRF